MKKFMTGNVSITPDAIKEVVLLKSSFSCLDNVEPLQPRVVLNCNHLFFGREGMLALKSLHDCKYFDYSEFEHMRKKYQEMLNTYLLATEGKMPSAEELS